MRSVLNPALNPMPLVVGDERFSAMAASETNLPIALRSDCTANSDNRWKVLCALVLLPYWIAGLYLGTRMDESAFRFPLRKGYFVAHTQLLTCVAGAWQP
jgi:hypothetical protein